MAVGQYVTTQGRYQNGVDLNTANFITGPDGQAMPNPYKGKMGGAPVAASPSMTANAPAPTAGAVTGGGYSLDQLTATADPWASQRGQYQTQLSSLMKDPSSFLQSDLWKASTAAGLEGVNRSAAAKGMLKSGNRLQALMDYGQKSAPENFFRMSDLLSGLAGAKNQNPGGGLSAMASLRNADTGAYQAETSRLAQQAGANQFDINRQDQQNQQRQQQQTLDSLMQWQQQQQQKQAQQNAAQQQQDYWSTWGQGSGPSYL